MPRDYSFLTTQYGVNYSDWIGILERFGPTILDLIVDGLRNGLSFDFLRRILDAFGPELFSHTLRSHCQRSVLNTGYTAGAPPIITGEQVDSLTAESNFIIDLLRQFLPVLMERYGKQILEWLMTLISGSLKTEAGQQLFLKHLHLDS